MIKIDKNLILPLKSKAIGSERLRCTYNFHKILDDSLQRMLNVLNKNTYVRPHKHENPDKREAFIILEGKVVVFEFDENGNPTSHIILNRNSQDFGCEIAPKTWHTIICLEDNSVLYEVKDGPYDELTDKNFANWAPTEGSEGTAEYNQKLIDKLKIFKV
jgi:cupin fold WbuC family metalloprotein